MRLRKNSQLHEAIKTYPDIVFFDKNVKENLSGKDNIMLELGTGKGRFITTLAGLCPEDFFVGVETRPEVLHQAVTKIKEKNLNNVKLVCANAQNLEEWFKSGQVANIYINFCDPWPKAKHEKRRLVGERFINSYKKVIKKGSAIFFKTDNGDLFNFGLEELERLGFSIEEKSFDLHQSSINNPAWTEYEEKFSHFGMKINYCKAVFKG